MLHPELDIPQVGEFIILDTKEKLDYAMHQYYCNDSNKNLNKLLDSFMKEKYDCLQRWDTLLSECVLIYQKGFYKPIIPSLVSIIDGLVALQCGNKSQSKLLINYCDRQIENQEDDILWTSIREFLDILFASSDFNGPRPLSLSRHWVSHGRDVCANWTEIDAIRLFVSVDCIAYVIDELKNDK